MRWNDSGLRLRLSIVLAAWLAIALPAAAEDAASPPTESAGHGIVVVANRPKVEVTIPCLLYTSDAADE